MFNNSTYKKILILLVSAFYLIFIKININSNSIKDKNVKKESKPIMEKILILPFNNITGPELDYLGEQIQISFLSFIEKSENYLGITLNNMNQYLQNNKITINELDNIENIINIANDFNAVSIIRGSFSKESDLIKIYFEVIDTASSKIVYKKTTVGKEDTSIFDVFNEIIDILDNTFSNLLKDSTLINVQTDNICQLFIDDEYIGKTPIKKRIFTGNHIIKVVYIEKDAVIYNKMHEFIKDDELKLDLRVFVNIEIITESNYDLYINNEKIGITPFKDNLFSNCEYRIKLTHIYENSKFKTIAYSTTISTVDYKDIVLNIPDKNIRQKFILTPINKSGIILMPIGSTFFLSGISILIYDLAFYIPNVLDKLYIYRDDKTNTDNYNSYYNAYCTNIALFSTSIALSGIGLVCIITSIPLITFKPKNNINKFFTISFDKRINIYYVIKF